MRRFCAQDCCFSGLSPSLAFCSCRPTSIPLHWHRSRKPQPTALAVLPFPPPSAPHRQRPITRLPLPLPLLRRRAFRRRDLFPSSGPMGTERAKRARVMMVMKTEVATSVFITIINLTLFAFSVLFANMFASFVVPHTSARFCMSEISSPLQRQLLDRPQVSQIPPPPFPIRSSLHRIISNSQTLWTHRA